MRKCCPECCVYILCLCSSVKKGLCEVTSKNTDVRESQGWRHRQGSTSMKRFADLSFQFHSSLCRCLSFSLSHCWHSRSYSYQNYALHCSPPCAHTSASVAWPYSMPAWACAMYPYHVNGTFQHVTFQRKLCVMGPCEGDH